MSKYAAHPETSSASPQGSSTGLVETSGGSFTSDTANEASTVHTCKSGGDQDDHSPGAGSMSHSRSSKKPDMGALARMHHEGNTTAAMPQDLQPKQESPLLMLENQITDSVSKPSLRPSLAAQAPSPTLVPISMIVDAVNIAQQHCRNSVPKEPEAWVFQKKLIHTSKDTLTLRCHTKTKQVVSLVLSILVAEI